MLQPPNLELLSYEARVILAAKAIKSNASMSLRRAAATYGVSRSTLTNRRAGMTSRRDIRPNRSNLTKAEEETLAQYIRKLDARGFAPTLQYVEDMANQLLAVRDGGRVGINWVYRFVRRRADVKSQVTRLRDRQRVLCSDPEVISP